MTQMQEQFEALGWEFGPLWVGGPCGYAWEGMAAGVQPVVLWLRPAPRKPDPNEEWLATDWCLTCLPDYAHFLADELSDAEPVYLAREEFLSYAASEWAAQCVLGAPQKFEAA